MTPEDAIVQELKALAETDAEREAPLEVEARLRAAFRGKHARRRARVWIPLAAAAAIAALVTLAMTLGMMNRAHPQKAVAQAESKAAAPGIGQAGAAAATVAMATSARPAAEKRAARRRAAQPREIVTDFFPLMADAPPIGDGAELVRVSLPASAMRDVGLPVREDRLSDRVQADVVVNYGMATAVRFVSYTKGE